MPSGPSLSLTALVLALTACHRAPSASPPRARTETPPPADAAALSQSASLALANTFHRVSVDAVPRDGTVTVGPHVLTVHASAGQVVEQPDHTAASVTVGLDVDGEAVPAFRAEAVAFDLNRSEAIEHAIRQWAVSIGVPIVDALVAAGWRTGTAPPDAGGASSALTLGAYRVFPGPTGLRGEESPTEGYSSDALHRTLMERLAPVWSEIVHESAPARFHSLKIVLHVVARAGQEGQCWVDGAPSEPLCRIARGIEWPASQGDYLVKQFYVLARP